MFCKTSCILQIFFHIHDGMPHVHSICQCTSFTKQLIFSHLLQILGHCCKNDISHASVWSLPGYPSCSGLAGTGTQPLDPGEGKKPQQGSPWCVSTRVWPSHTKKTTSFELIWNKFFFYFLESDILFLNDLKCQNGYNIFYIHPTPSYGDYDE